MNTIKYLLIASVNLVLFSSCNSWDKAEPTPSFIYVPEVKLANKPAFGTLKQDFTESYIYLDGQLLGVYPIPGMVPILSTGSHTLTVFGGIHNYGIKSQPQPYPLLDKVEIPVNLVSGKIDTLTPVVKYRDDITAAINESFEGGNTILSATLKGKGILLTTQDAFEGKQCGLFQLDTLSPLIEVGSVDLNLPNDGTRIYIELHYKNEVDFLVGIKGYNSTDQLSTYIVGLRPSTEWKKVYIDITDYITASEYTNHKIILETGLPFSGTTLTRDKANVLIDNLKVLY